MDKPVKTVVKSLAVICFLVGVSIALDGYVATAEARKRSLTLHNTHTGETQTITFKRNGRYIESGLRELNRFARDWRRNESTKMDPALFDLIWEVYQEVGARKPIYLVSGYRSPATNEMLRSRSRGVARNSRHTKGQAIDFYIPGVPIKKLREAALKRQAGGVGYYPTSGSPFVHVDTGSVRHWPKMTRRQLMALFPDGKTLHLPSDGKPLKGYQQALAAYKKGTLGSGTRVASAISDEGRGLFGTRRNATQSSQVASAPTPSPRSAGTGNDDAVRNASKQPRNGVFAGLFNNNRAQTSAQSGSAAAGPTPSANVSTMPGVAAALPADASVPRPGASQVAREVARVNAVPRARPAAVVQLAARLSPAQDAPNGASQRQPVSPFQLASAETQALLATGASSVDLASTTSDTPLDARGRIAAAALQSASQRRQNGEAATIIAAASSVVRPSASAGTAPKFASASQLATGTGTTMAATGGLPATGALAFLPKARPSDDGGLAFDGIDGTITSAPAPEEVPANRPTSAAELGDDRLSPPLVPGDALASNVLTSNTLSVDFAGAGPSTVLTYTGLNDDLPPIPEPATASSALPEQSLTLPVSASATATISAAEIAEIFSGAGQQSAQDAPSPTVASRFDDAMTVVAQRSYNRHVHMISRLLTGELALYAKLVHPDQRSLAPLLAPTPLSHATSQFRFSVSMQTGALVADEPMRQAMR